METLSSKKQELTLLTPLEQKIWESLEEVFDPEIPVISVVDLGIISKVVESHTAENQSILVYMTPTFSGCPAIELIASEVREKTKQVSGFEHIEVIIDKNSGWTTNAITEKGLKILNGFGLSPPKRYEGELDVEEALSNAKCPFCGGENTAMRTPFGSTLCRSMHFCYNCNQAFEQFKSI